MDMNTDTNNGEMRTIYNIPLKEGEFISEEALKELSDGKGEDEENE